MTPNSCYYSDVTNCFSIKKIFHSTSTYSKTLKSKTFASVWFKTLFKCTFTRKVLFEWTGEQDQSWKNHKSFSLTRCVVSVTQDETIKTLLLKSLQPLTTADVNDDGKESQKSQRIVLACWSCKSVIWRGRVALMVSCAPFDVGLCFNPVLKQFPTFTVSNKIKHQQEGFQLWQNSAIRPSPFDRERNIKRLCDKTLH